MKSLARLPVVIFAMICACLVQARTELNSFLNRPAITRAQLVNQLRSDSAVADRYMRHFAMTKSQLVELFSTLSIKSIKQAEVFEVYNVPRNGMLRVRHMKFAKGTKIWVDAIGTPVLKVSCGNPLTKGPNSPVALSENESTPQSVPVEDFRPIVVEASPIATEVLPVALVIEPSVPEVVMTQIPTLTDEPPTVGPTTKGEEPALLAPIPTPNIIGIIPTIILPILPIIGGSNTINPPPVPPAPPPVPEPSAGLVLAVGLGLAIVRMRRS